MSLIFKFLCAIPIVPAFGGIFTNRSRPTAWLCSPIAVVLNCSDRWFCFIYDESIDRVYVVRDRDGRFQAFVSRPFKE